MGLQNQNKQHSLLGPKKKKRNFTLTLCVSRDPTPTPHISPQPRSGSVQHPNPSGKGAGPHPSSPIPHPSLPGRASPARWSKKPGLGIPDFPGLAAFWFSFILLVVFPPPFPSAVLNFAFFSSRVFRVRQKGAGIYCSSREASDALCSPQRYGVVAGGEGREHSELHKSSFCVHTDYSRKIKF